MKLLKFFSCVAVAAVVLPGLSSCASAAHLPAADSSPVLLASAEEPHYTSEVLEIAETKNQSTAVTDKHDHGSATELPYVCPMHSEVQSDKPGKCPQCGMKLQLREKTGGNHEHH